MRCVVWMAAVALLPVMAWAQAAFPTEFPAGAMVMEPSAVQQRLSGKVVNMTYANGQQVRLEYKERYAYLNVGNASDTGLWRAEPGRVCIEWQRFAAGCFEVRSVGEVLYAKRATNGEIVLMNLQ